MGLITEAHYSRDNTRLYESNYKVTVDGGKGEFIVVKRNAAAREGAIREEEKKAAKAAAEQQMQKRLQEPISFRS
jgi:hypothetical protein